MGVVFDILGSFVVRAAIVAVMLNLMLSLHEQLQKKNEQVYMSEVMDAPAQTLASDFKNAGYNSSKVFPTASSSEARFYADTDNNGTSELIRFYVSSGILYRTIDGGSDFELARSVSLFRLVYYDSLGNPKSGLNVSGIKSIYIRLRLQSVSYGVTTRYSGKSDSTLYTTEWREHIFPKNL
ncbi:MAG: hypothetical protein F9K22_12520 [Bacteroidetes bacterium]|nr:MAG: hypothetical protein F9K22_12520 [Bacteroidota bacterium]